MFAAGCSDAEIAAALGRTVRSIANRRYETDMVSYHRDTRPKDGSTAKKLEIYQDTLDTLRLIARVDGLDEIMDTIEQCERRICTAAPR